MSNPYPHLDSSSPKPSSTQRYEYISPPKSSHASLDCNQFSLSENLLPKARSNDESLSKTSSILIMIELLIESIVYYIALGHLPIFEFCFWEFTFRRYSEIEMNPTSVGYSGSLNVFQSSLGCDIQDYSRCAGICDLVANLGENRNWLSYAFIVRYLISCFGFIWMAIDIKGKNFNRAKMAFGASSALAAVFLSFGIAGSFFFIKSQDLVEPLEFNDGASTEEFEWKSGFYVFVFIPVWMGVMNTIAYLKFRN